MKPLAFTLLATVAATPLIAQDSREMEAHVHGVSTLEIAIEGGLVEMFLKAPGMDLVGFEYEAATDADKAAIETALQLLADPANVLTLSAAAECQPTEVDAHLAGDHEDDHHEHDDDHGHEETHDHADEHDHDHEAKHDHDEHAEHAEHTEFQTHYAYTCGSPKELTGLNVTYFATFENAQELHVTYVTEAGAGTAEANRANTDLSFK